MPSTPASRSASACSQAASTPAVSSSPSALDEPVGQLEVHPLGDPPGHLRPGGHEHAGADGHGEVGVALAPLGHRRQRERRREPHDVGVALPARQVAARGGDDADRQPGVVLLGERPGLAQHRARPSAGRPPSSSSGVSPRSSSTSCTPSASSPSRSRRRPRVLRSRALSTATVSCAVAPHLGRDHQPRHRRPRRGVVGDEEARGDRRERVELAGDRREVRAVRDVELGRDVQRHETSVSDPVSTS